MNLRSSSWVVVGEVGRAHGLRGHFFVSGRTEPIPKNCKQLFIGRDPENGLGRLIVINENRQASNQGGLLALKGVVDRSQAEELRGQTIWVQREDLELDETDEFFWSDLLGKPVIDNAGHVLGVIDYIDNYGASDIVSILSEDARRLSIPLVSQYVDMNFSAQPERLLLKVSSSVFAELWDD